MKNLLPVLKAPATGGLVFLIPILVAFGILAKAMQLMKVLTRPLEKLMPAAFGSGPLSEDLLVLAFLFLVCLPAGLVAVSAPGRKLVAALESKLTAMVPGYGFVKGFTDSISQSDETARSFTPVLPRFDDYSQIAFEVERSPTGQVLLYLPGAPQRVWESYCQRGDSENRIKELKHDLEIDRTSCTSFLANQFRVLLTAAACVLMPELRCALRATELARAMIGSLRLRLLKVGATVTESARRIVVSMPSSHPWKDLWRRAAARVVALA